MSSGIDEDGATSPQNALVDGISQFVSPTKLTRRMSGMPLLNIRMNERRINPETLEKLNSLIDKFPSTPLEDLEDSNSNKGDENKANKAPLGLFGKLFGR